MPTFSADRLPQRCLVVGLGSIGTRHARLLGELGHSVQAVSRRGAAAFPDLASALAQGHPNYVVIANETAAHDATLNALAASGFGGRVLVEKPLFSTPAPLPEHRFAALAVAYHLRFHPALRRLKALLEGERILSAQIYVGQHLPDWRPGRDYRATYSGRADQGGGALRDLSHELDYARWLFGPCRRLAALGGRWSDLEIDSDDTFVLLAGFDGCPAATIQTNYTDRQTRREAVINTERHTLSLDLIAGTLRRDREEVERFAVERDAPYRAMHRAILEGAGDGVPCDGPAGVAVMRMIDACEQSARTARWIEVENHE